LKNFDAANAEGIRGTWETGVGANTIQSLGAAKKTESRIPNPEFRIPNNEFCSADSVVSALGFYIIH